MKIKVINIFNTNKKYVTPEILKDANYLIKKMHSEKTYTETTSNFIKKTEVRGLKIKDATFKDGQFLAKRNSKNELIPYGKDSSMLEFGETRLIINNSTGQIIEHKKPFFKTWKSIFSQVRKIITTAVNNYDNDNIVKKIVHHGAGLTENGKIKAANELKNIFDTFKNI